jgi:DNA-binding MarR family transcriptional regulator
MGDGEGGTGPSLLLRCPTYLLGQLLREAKRIYELNSGGLRAPHLSVLAGLADFGPVSQKELAARLRLDASDLVGLLDDLERGELAQRVRDRQDRRRHAVSITPAGTAELRRGLHASARSHDELFAALSDPERSQLTRLLLRAYGHHDPVRVPPDMR